MRPLAICVFNPKQGCGKSSLCVHLGEHFAQTGMNVLRVDAHPGCISRGLINAAVRGSQPTLPTGSFSERDDREALDGYDLVLFDCPPEIYQHSWSAMLAADYVVMPLSPEDLDIAGLRVCHEAILNAHRLNSRLRLLGHIVTRFDAGLAEHNAFENRVRALYGETVFKTVIPEAPAFALDDCRPTSCSGYIEDNPQMGALATELMRRIDGEAEGFLSPFRRRVTQFTLAFTGLRGIATGNSATREIERRMEGLERLPTRRFLIR